MLYYSYIKKEGVNSLENKQVATVRTITGELIGGFILYGIVFGILYSFIYSAITNRISEDSLILTAIIAIIFQGITVFCVWRCSIATTFRKRLIETNDVKIVMKNLMIFTVIICFLTALINFAQVNETVENEINSSLMVSEMYMQYLYDDDEIAQYEEEKEKARSETKTKLYTYLAVLEIGLLAVYLGVVPLQNKAILKYAV